jgi:NarL family two-component system response regulator LiaR
MKNMIQKYKIIIVDDHPIVREGLINIVSDDDSYTVVGSCGDGAEVIPLINKVKPDIVVLDISLPNKNGLQIIRELKEKKIDLEIIILTMYKEEEYFEEAMDLGVKGYLLKENALKELANCLNRVVNGKHYICSEFSEIIINKKNNLESFIASTPGLQKLSKTEKKILKLISQNLTSKQIADKLFLSVRTVQNHRTNITQKLEISGYNRLLQFAIENKQYL